jgi:hypothetical protein
VAEESATDGDFATDPLGLENCYQCHAQAMPSWDIEAVFPQWLMSRHANFDTEDSTGYFDNRPDPFDSALYSYSEIVGHPRAGQVFFFGSCAIPCHKGSPIDSGFVGDVIASNTGGVLFSDPNLGEVRRGVIDCEACHQTGHFKGDSAAEFVTPGYDECGYCHGLGDEDHHDPHSYRYWQNASGSSPGSNNAPALTTESISGVQFSVWMLPDSSAWLDTATPPNVNPGLYDGPYYFNGDRTIFDTHFDQVFIVNEDDKLTIFDRDDVKLGYIDTTNTSPNSGMVRADSEEACTSSCHKPHLFDNWINMQWFNGGHHPVAEGPLYNRGWSSPDIVPTEPENWRAVGRSFSDGCLRCHSANGFAEMVPNYGDAVESAGQGAFLTCNACHDGENYPDEDNKRLRYSGAVSLFDHEGSIIRNVDGGNSAICIYCHQGRETGEHVAADIQAGSPRFRNMHYLAAGAMMYGEKGYEYSGMTYAGDHFHTILASSCATCHMSEADPASLEVGGHTFMIARETGEENLALCQATCHQPLTDLDTFRVHLQDWDGDGSSVDSVKNEVEDLLTDTLAAIEAYDSPADADTTPNLYHDSGYPYFHTNSGQAWDAALAKAAFNWQYVYKEYGAYAHNPAYAVQLLRDSYNDLVNGDPAIDSLGGERP